jgi:hypothetical protein
MGEWAASDRTRSRSRISSGRRARATLAGRAVTAVGRCRSGTVGGSMRAAWSGASGDEVWNRPVQPCADCSSVLSCVFCTPMVRARRKCQVRSSQLCLSECSNTTTARLRHTVRSCWRSSATTLARPCSLSRRCADDAGRCTRTPGLGCLRQSCAYARWPVDTDSDCHRRPARDDSGRSVSAPGAGIVRRRKVQERVMTGRLK